MKKKKETKQEKQAPAPTLVPHPVNELVPEENAEPITEENIDTLPDEEDIYEEDELTPPQPGEGP